MQTLYVPKYNLHYRVNPRNPRELQWSRKPFGPATQWQHAMSFKNPIRALDLDDETKQGVVVLNDSTTYVGSGVRTWGRKFYPAGTRIYSLYTIGESKMNHKMKIKVHESNISKEEILHLPISEYISKHPDKFKIVKEYDWSGLMCIQIFNPYKQEWFFLCDIRQGELLSDTGRPYIEVMGVFLDTWDDTITRIRNKDISSNGSVYSYMDSRALYGTKGLDKTWLDALTPNTLEALYTRFTKFFKNVQDYYAKKAESVKHPTPMKIKVHETKKNETFASMDDIEKIENYLRPLMVGKTYGKNSVSPEKEVGYAVNDLFRKGPLHTLDGAVEDDLVFRVKFQDSWEYDSKDAAEENLPSGTTTAYEYTCETDEFLLFSLIVLVEELGDFNGVKVKDLYATIGD